MPDEISFEAAMEKLQGLVARMESGELTLEQSLAAFEEGMALGKLCQDRIAAAERKIEVLTKVNAEGKPEFQEFPKG